MIAARSTPVNRLHVEFSEVAQSTKIGGASVLRHLSELANDCISGTNKPQDAVAFVLSTIFALHAEDRDERVVTGDDTYLLMGSGGEYLADAISFLDRGGTADEAVSIITNLIQITPHLLYRHSS